MGYDAPGTSSAHGARVVCCAIWFHPLSTQPLTLLGHRRMLAQLLHQPVLVLDRYPLLLGFGQFAPRRLANDQVTEGLGDASGDLASQRLDGLLRLPTREARERA